MSIGYAIIGCGRVAPNHVDGVRASDGGTLLWACDVDDVAAKSFAAEHGIPHWTADAADMLNDPDVTAVSIATDHGRHAELAEAALRAGKHVLVEKPLALSAADARRLVALAAEHDRVLSVVSQHRYDPVVRAVRQWLADGLLGTLLFAQVCLEAQREPDYYAQSYWRGTWAGEGGSALVNQGYHCLDVSRGLLGDMTVHAAVATRAVLGDVIETEDTMSALLSAGGVPITLNVTVGSATLWRTRIDIVGSAGAVTLDLDHPGTLHRGTGEAVEVAAARLPISDGDEPVPGTSYYGISHRSQIADFLTAVVGGHAMETDGHDGMAMVSLLEQLYNACHRDKK
ncbi:MULTISPECIES: Gfo/Idh/MocA family protein [unclassified Micromonospora]|uniref:Gfo/Idh/MocA family protein n=1 Tax=unclassified Micromonospora TaxID=2617518 RepID=UPI003A8714D4